MSILICAKLYHQIKPVEQVSRSVALGAEPEQETGLCDWCESIYVENVYDVAAALEFGVFGERLMPSSHSNIHAAHFFANLTLHQYCCTRKTDVLFQDYPDC